MSQKNKALSLMCLSDRALSGDRSDQLDRGLFLRHWIDQLKSLLSL